MAHSEKSAFVMMCVPEDAPYVAYYADIFTKQGKSIDYIIWNRNNKNLNSARDYRGFHVFEVKSKWFKSRFSKIIDMIKFGKFAQKILQQGNYDRVVVFTIQTSIFIKKYLLNNDVRYIVDVRDYTPLLKIKYFKKQFEKIVSKSFAVVSSSPQYVEFLPKTSNLYVSHNIHPDLITGIKPVDFKCEKPYKILTIGQVRDYKINLSIITEYSNSKEIKFIFAGKGQTLTYLNNYVVREKIHNVIFLGPYKKEDELSIYNKADFINAVTPSDINGSRLLTNRLYLSVIEGKPLIVNKNTFQGAIVERFNIGIAIAEPKEIKSKIQDFMQNKVTEYNENRIKFIQWVYSDIMEFNSLIENFLH